MKTFYALAVSVIGGSFWAQVAMAGGPSMPCETGVTLHISKAADPDCSRDNCPKVLAAVNPGKSNRTEDSRSR